MIENNHICNEKVTKIKFDERRPRIQLIFIFFSSNQFTCLFWFSSTNSVFFISLYLYLPIPHGLLYYTLKLFLKPNYYHFVLFSPQNCFIYFCLKAVFILHQGKFSLQQTKSITENHSRPKCTRGAQSQLIQ